MVALGLRQSIYTQFCAKRLLVNIWSLWLIMCPGLCHMKVNRLLRCLANNHLSKWHPIAYHLQEVCIIHRPPGKWHKFPHQLHREAQAKFNHELQKHAQILQIETFMLAWMV